MQVDKDRNTGLDIVRSIAILCVVLLHLVIPYGIILKKDFSWIPIPDGVDIFFVLSGYLIGGILVRTFQEKQVTQKEIFRFWTMRWFRTLPAYYFFTFVVFVLNGFKMPLKNLLFLQNVWKFYPNPYLETWSLCVEEWFYLILPLAIYFFTKLFSHNAMRAILYAAIGMLFFSLLTRMYFYMVYNHTVQDFMMVRSLVVTRLDAIAIGVFGAWIKYNRTEMWHQRKSLNFYMGLSLFVGMTVLSALVMYRNKANVDLFHWNFGFILYSVSIILMFPKIEEVRIKNKYIYGFVTNTSKISYSMYLIHNTILFHTLLLIFMYFKQSNLLLFTVIYLLLLFSLSNISYRFLEKRWLNYRAAFVRKYFD